MQVGRNDLNTFNPQFIDQLKTVLPMSYLDYLRTDGQVQKKERVTKFFAMAKHLGVELSSTPNESELLQQVTRFNQRYDKWVKRASVGKLLFASDTAVGDLGWGNPPRLNGHLEMLNWHRIGIPLGQILRAATIDNAKASGLDHEI